MQVKDTTKKKENKQSPNAFVLNSLGSQSANPPPLQLKADIENESYAELNNKSEHSTSQSNSIHQGSIPPFQFKLNNPAQNKSQTAPSNVAPIQLKKMFLTQNAHTYKTENGVVKEGLFGRVGKKLKAGQKVNIDETNTKQSEKGNTFYKLMTKNHFIRTSSLVEHLSVLGIKNSQLNEGDTDVEEENEEVLDIVESSLSDSSGSLDDFHSEATDSDFTKKKLLKGATAKNVEISKGALSTASGAFGMIMAIKNIAKGEGFEKVEGLFDLLSNTASTVSGVSTIVKGVSTKLDGSDPTKMNKTSDSLGKWSGSVGDGINAIKSFVATMKEIYEFFKDAFSLEGTSKGEKFESSMSILNNALETASSAVNSIKGILEIFEKGVGGLAKAVPGLSIALSGADIGLRVYQMIVAGIAKRQMRKKKQELREKYKNSVTKELKYKITGNQKKDSEGHGRVKIDKNKLAQRIDELKAKAKLNEIETVELQELEELSFVKEMEYINKKRMNRAGVKIGLDLINIAGEIATLTGHGAVAGVPMKAFAAGASVSMSIARKIKQAGRDKAAKEKEKRLALNINNTKESKWEKVFNAEKNSEAKTKKRKEDAIFIFKQFASMGDDPKSDGFKNKLSSIESYISATGAAPKGVYRGFNSGGLKGAMEVLIKAMAKRE